jgi:hypothetical protein
MIRVRRVLVTLVLLVLSACQPQQEPPPIGPLPSGAADLVLRWAELPGLMPPGAAFTSTRLSLYGDGTVIIADPSGAALPSPTQRKLSPAGINRVTEAARDAGLTTRTDFGTPAVLDAPATVFTVAAATPMVSTIPGLGIDVQTGLTGAQRAARQRALEFRQHLTDLDRWLGDDVAGRSQPYNYARLAVAGYAQDADPQAPQRTWPLDDLATAGQPYETGRCLVVAGDQLAAVRQAAATATVNTQWRSGAALYHLTFRPLLPDESGCP